jgi:hypothetical protein
MKYKKGQIVPRTLVRCKHRKTQHRVKFGADVEVDGRTIKALSNGSVLIINCSYIGGKKGKPRLYLNPIIQNINIIGFMKKRSCFVEYVEK